MDNIKYYKRKAPIHLPCRDNGIPNIIFLTVCTKDKKSILANQQSHDTIIDAWNKSDYWIVGKYMIMPDHIHLFCRCNNNDYLDFKPWVTYWKRLISKNWYSSDDKPIFQESFWDRQIRSEEHFYRKWEYIKNNPVYAGLVQKADDWPFQGQLNIMF